MPATQPDGVQDEVNVDRDNGPGGEAAEDFLSVRRRKRFRELACDRYVELLENLGAENKSPLGSGARQQLPSAFLLPR